MTSIRHDCGLIFTCKYAKEGKLVSCPYCRKAPKFTVTSKNIVKMGR